MLYFLYETKLIQVISSLVQVPVFDFYKFIQISFLWQSGGMSTFDLGEHIFALGEHIFALERYNS